MVELQTTPLRIETTTRCNACKSVVTKSFEGYYSCKTCDSWTKDVTHTSKPLRVVDDGGCT